MNFNEFKKLYKNTVVIDSSTFGFKGNANSMRRQAVRWADKKYIYALKKGLYILNEEYGGKNVSPLFAANQLVTPSYVSMEYAMGVYGLIPEKVVVFTSITPKKTQSFENILGRFEYKSISKKLFFGIVQRSAGEQKYFIAEPEKAVLDFLYFAYDAEPESAYFESMRFQNLDVLNTGRLKAYSEKYNKRVQNIVKELLKYIKRQKTEFKKI